MVIALGIDPGTRHLGWGVVRSEGNRLRHVAHGVIEPPASQPLSARLVFIDAALREIVEQYRPDVGSVETVFFHRDVQAASKLGHARGVVLLGLARASVAIAEYAPAHVKLAVTGKGNAEKHQVAHMIRALLSLEEAPRSDAADALALAVTHCRRGPIDAAMAERVAAAGENPGLAALLRGRRRGASGPRTRRAVTR